MLVEYTGKVQPLQRCNHETVSCLSTLFKNDQCTELEVLMVSNFTLKQTCIAT